MFWNFCFFLPPDSKFILQWSLGNLQLFEVLHLWVNFLYYEFEDYRIR